jgi:hypothetical protein
VRTYDEIQAEALDVKPGDKVNLWFWSLGQHRLCHVMYILDGHYKDQIFVVVRYYGKRKQWWHHEMIEENDFKQRREKAK